MSYFRYGYVSSEPTAQSGGGGGSLTPGQEAILNNLGSIQTGNALQRLVTLDPTGDLYSIDPVREWTSDVTRHMAVDAQANRYLPFGYPNGLKIDLTGDIYSLTSNNDSMAILPYACKANTNIQFELMFGSITASNQSSLHFGVIDPSLLSTETIGDINNWVLDPDLYKNEGMLMTLEYHSNQVKYLYDGGAYTTVNPIDYRAASFGDMTKGMRVLVGLRANGVEVVYVDSSNVTKARHRISQTIGDIDNKYFFIALGNSTMRFRICTSSESITYTGVLTPMSNFVDKTHRNDTLLPSSYKQGVGTVIAPVPLVDIFSVWNNTAISAGNKNGVFAPNSYSASTGLWNSAAVVPYKVKENTYFEFRMDSGADMNHGVGVGFIKKESFEAIPDVGQWAITYPSFTTDGGYLLFQNGGGGAAKVHGASYDGIQHMAPQRDLRPNDVLQLGISKQSTRRIELVIFDGSTKAVIYDMSYVKSLPFNFDETLYPVIVTNHAGRGFSARLVPDIYRGSAINTGVTPLLEGLAPATYPQFDISQRGKLMYHPTLKRPMICDQDTISNIVTIREVPVLPVYDKEIHKGSLLMFNGVVYIGSNRAWVELG